MSKENFFVSNDKLMLDVKLIHNFLSQESYWAKNISIDTINITIENSLCFGLFTKDKEQVGYARVITDYATVAHIVDVFVIREYRALGLSKMLIQNILLYLNDLNLRKIYLFTHDAPELYKKFGFKNSNHPEHYMEIINNLF